MLDKDKLILAVYICVEGMNRAKACKLMCEVQTKYENYFDDSVKLMFFPVTSEETHVDVLTPKYIINGEEYIPEDINNKIQEIENDQLI